MDISSISKMRVLLILIVISTVLRVNATVAFDEINTTAFGVAIKGFDTVAYHTEGRAVKGQSKFVHRWNESKWYFASAENRDLFAANPERYAPQYGGY